MYVCMYVRVCMSNGRRKQDIYSPAQPSPKALPFISQGLYSLFLAPEAIMRPFNAVLYQDPDPVPPCLDCLYMHTVQPMLDLTVYPTSPTTHPPRKKTCSVEAAARCQWGDCLLGRRPGWGRAALRLIRLVLALSVIEDIMLAFSSLSV